MSHGVYLPECARRRQLRTGAGAEMCLAMLLLLCYCTIDNGIPLLHQRARGGGGRPPACPPLAAVAAAYGGYGYPYQRWPD